MSGKFPIAFVAGSFPLRSETFVWREVRELRRRGWTMHTFGLRPPAEATPEELADLRAQTRYLYGRGAAPAASARRGAGVFGVIDALHPGEHLGLRDRLKLPFQAAAGRRLGRWIGSLGIRHVHAHFAHAPTSVAMYAAAYAGIPFSFTGHANDLFQRRQLLKRKLQRAAFVACISRWHRDLYRTIHPDGSYPVIRCGVPLEVYGPPPEPVPGRLRVLSVARLIEKKGLDLLIRAVRDLPAVDLTIAGDGPQLQQLQSLAAPAGDRIRFLGGIDPSAVAEQLRRNDAFALPCRPTRSGDRDGIPVALMEAMACGLPVLSGDLPAIGELISPGRSGVLVETGLDAVRSVDQIRQALETLVGDVTWRRELGNAGRQQVREEFGLDLNVDRLEGAIIASGGR